MTTPTLAALRRFPVKSMAGERIDHAQITARGLAGDRAYAVVDVEDGTVATAKDRRFQGLLRCEARFVEPPGADGPPPPVRITLPDGGEATSGADADRALSEFLGRAARLVAAADLPGRTGPFFDAHPVSVLTTATLERLGGLLASGTVDPRRFRMNVVVRVGPPGFPEDEWVGRRLALGDAARLRVTAPDFRCVMTTLAQAGLEADADVLRVLARTHRLPLEGKGELPCAGVYAECIAPGRVAVGDRVTLEDEDA